MLTIHVNPSEQFNNETNEFFTTPGGVLVLEHSLLSISKWEAKWKKPFLKKDNGITQEQFIDYIKCMTINKNVPDDLYKSLTRNDVKTISEYIEDPMTATWFKDRKARGSNGEVQTSELLYYYMFEAGIPIDCERWHLNRLLVLIRIYGEKNSGNNKMNKKDVLAQNRALNAARHAKRKH